MLGLATLGLAWQNCGLRGQRAQLRTELTAAESRTALPTDRRPSSARDFEQPPPPRSLGRIGADLGLDQIGLAELAWLADTFGMQAGEDLLDYRDRVVPIVVELVEPQRQRVRRNLDGFAAEAGIDADQRALLSEAGAETATTLRDRVLGAVMGGEIMPPFRPERMVHFARDILDIVDDTAQRFRASLSPDQLDALDNGPFDLIDYLVFSTRWEDLLELP
jgi:hypothetical protein